MVLQQPDTLETKRHESSRKNKTTSTHDRKTPRAAPSGFHTSATTLHLQVGRLSYSKKKISLFLPEAAGQILRRTQNIPPSTASEERHRRVSEQHHHCPLNTPTAVPTTQQHPRPRALTHQPTPPVPTIRALPPSRFLLIANASGTHCRVFIPSLLSRSITSMCAPGELQTGRFQQC